MTAAEEIQQLRDRIEELEDLAGMGNDDMLLLKQALGLTPAQCQILGIIRKRSGIASREMIYGYLYGGRPECDQPAIKIVDVLMVNVRRALLPHGIKIDTVWCIGWQMSEKNRTALKALMESQMTAAEAIPA